jgi:hypothetical protein
VGLFATTALEDKASIRPTSFAQRIPARNLQTDLREKDMRKFFWGLSLSVVAVSALQGCASNEAVSGQAPVASGGNADQEFVTGSRIPRKVPKPSENVVIKDASEKTGL